MTDSRLPEPVRDLLRSDVPSITHLEALIAVTSRPGEAVTVGELLERLGGERAAVARAAQELAASGLLETSQAAGEAVYRFAPRDAGRGAAVQALAEMYRRFPVQVVRAVYERPAPPVQQLADAFRLRKPE
jgi:DNA-binding IclR family transcriptional regulator